MMKLVQNISFSLTDYLLKAFLRIINSEASSDHLSFVLYIGFTAGVCPMMYYLGIAEYRRKLTSFIQDIKFKKYISTGKVPAKKNINK